MASPSEANVQHARSLVILFASQTGTAQEVAERLAREGRRRHFTVTCCAMDEYTWRLLPTEPLVLFVASTTGQGDPPDNMRSFWRFLLKKSLPSHSLCSLRYGVFGLGDSSYTNYNVVGKRLDKRLEQLGGRRIVQRGLGDDQDECGYETALDAWRNEVWAAIMACFPLPPGVEVLPPHHQFPTHYQVHFTSSDKAPVVSHLPVSRYDPFYARVMKNKRLTATDWHQDVRHIVFDLTGAPLAYQPGDVVCILPRNRPREVQEFLDLIRLDPEQTFFLHPRGHQESAETPPFAIQQPCTIRELFEGHLDIFGTPRTSFFERLVHSCTDTDTRERLEYFVSCEGKNDLFNYCHKERRPYAAVFRDFPSIRPSLEELIELIPRMTPRSFSISSSPKAHPNELHITVAVVHYTTPQYKLERWGVCSTWLASLEAGAHVPIWTKPGLIHLPRDPGTPIVMVGPGTGVAPFRSFLHERACMAREGIPLGDALLFNGCRHATKDFLYANEWDTLVDAKALSGYFPAFSRDQAHKVYVQHRLLDRGAEVYQIISCGGIVYVAGSSKGMPSDVRTALVKILSQHGDMPASDASTQLRAMEQASRLLLETWS